MAPQAYQTLISLPIYMGNGTVDLCKTDLVSWPQTSMSHYSVEAYFHTPHVLLSGFESRRIFPDLRFLEPKIGSKIAMGSVVVSHAPLEHRRQLI